MMKIKDLDPKRSLFGVRFRYPPDRKWYYWFSQWQRGVWGKKSVEDTQIFPLFCDDLQETLEWDVKAPSVSRRGGSNARRVSR